MKYAQRDELVSGLRDLADFIEDHGLEIPDLHVTVSGHVSTYNYHSYKDRTEDEIKKIMRRSARAMKPCEKVHEGRSFRLRKKFGILRMEISTSREAICESVVVGKREVPEYISPAHTEDIIEWICGDPLLAS